MTYNYNKPAVERIEDALALLLRISKPGSFFTAEDVAAIAQSDIDQVYEVASALGIQFDEQHCYPPQSPNAA